MQPNPPPSTHTACLPSTDPDICSVRCSQGIGTPVLSESCISRIVEMAWEDRTAFEAIEAQFGLNESAVVALMRRHVKPSSFRMWRTRMAGRRTKHAALRGQVFLRHCATHTRQ